MSKKIKPNELKMIGSASSNKTDNHDSGTSVKTKGEIGQTSKAIDGQSSKVNKLKRKTSEPKIIRSDVSRAAKEVEVKESFVGESNRKRLRDKPIVDSHELHPSKKKELPSQSQSASTLSKNRSSSAKTKSSSNNTSKAASGKRPQFPLNPYAVDPSDPLLKGDSINISSYIGNLFGYSKDR